MRKESIFLFFLLACHIGHALKCYTCIGDCQTMQAQDCGPNQQCITKQKSSDGKIQIQQRSCAGATECTGDSSDPSFTQTCCSTDLCNGPASTSSPTSTSSSTSTPVSASTSPAASGSGGAGSGGAGSGGAGSGGSGSRDPGRPLVCYSCTDYTCWVVTTAKCKPDERCLTKYVKHLGMDMRKKGCGNSTICSKETTEVITAGTTSTVKNECCDTDLCNFGISLKFSSIAIIGSILFLVIIKLY